MTDSLLLCIADTIEDRIGELQAIEIPDSLHDQLLAKSQDLLDQVLAYTQTIYDKAVQLEDDHRKLVTIIDAHDCFGSILEEFIGFMPPPAATQEIEETLEAFADSIKRCKTQEARYAETMKAQRE